MKRLRLARCWSLSLGASQTFSGPVMLQQLLPLITTEWRVDRDVWYFSRKGAKVQRKLFRNAAALCPFAPLREILIPVLIVLTASITTRAQTPTLERGVLAIRDSSGAALSNMRLR